MASEHKYLVPSLLSVTSLHLARLHDSKEEKDHMHSIAASQMNEALSHFRADLSKIHERNAAALFACSTLTAVYFFRTSTLELEEIRSSITTPDTTQIPTQLKDKLIQPFLKTIRSLRGVISVLTPGYSWVTGGSLSPLCTRPWWPKVFMPTTSRALDEDRRLAELARLWKSPRDRASDDYTYDAAQAKCLTEALMYLRQTFALVSLLTDPSEDYTNPGARHGDAISYSVDDTTVGLLKDRAAIFLWATQTSNEFVAMVEGRNREALVLMAHYAVLFGRIRNVWWMDGFGAQTIWAIGMALGREDWGRIEWTVQAVGVDLGGGGMEMGMGLVLEGDGVND
jgi:hypothetical protein